MEFSSSFRYFAPRSLIFPNFPILFLKPYPSLKFEDKVTQPKNGEEMKLKFCITSANLYVFRQPRGRERDSAVIGCSISHWKVRLILEQRVNRQARVSGPKSNLKPIL
jgi:hypothetical protein